MYTELSRLSRGKYIGKRFDEVPIEYIVQIWRDEKFNDKDFLEYIECNLISLRQKACLKGITDVLITKSDTTKKSIDLRLFCKKFTYMTEKEARLKLKEIRERVQKNQHKPLRAYECKKCNYWHLTSRPDPRFIEK